MDERCTCMYLSPRLVWLIKHAGRQHQTHSCACSCTCEFFRTLQQGRRRTSSEPQANGQNDCTRWRVSHALCRLKEARKGLFAILRLQIIAPQFIQRWWHNPCCHNSGIHAHNPAHDGAPKSRVQIGEENQYFFANAAVNDVSQYGWPKRLIEILWRYWQVHGLSEAVVGDRQGHGKKNRSQHSQSCGRGKMKVLFSDTGKYVVFQNVHEIRLQGDLQELCDLHGIQSFLQPPSGKVVPPACCSPQALSPHSAKLQPQHRLLGVQPWPSTSQCSQMEKKTSSNVAMSQRLFWDARMYRAECGRIVQFKPVLQTWNGLFMKISNTKLTHSCTNILRVERTLIKHPLGRMHWRNMHAAQQFWMFLVT